MRFRIICEVEIDDEPYSYIDEETGRKCFVGPTDPEERALEAFSADAYELVTKIEKI